MSLSPSSNVNDGSESGVIWLGGLPFQLSGLEQALPGYLAEASIFSSYRIAETSGRKYELLFDFYSSKIWIDGRSELNPEELHDTDFDLNSTAIGTRISFKNAAPHQIQLLMSIGRNWRGGEIFSNWYEVSSSISHSKNHSNSRATLSYRVNDRVDFDFKNSNGVRLSFDLESDRSSSFKAHYGLFAEFLSSHSSLIHSTAYGLSAGINILDAKYINWGAGVVFENRSYDKWSVGAFGRNDLSVSMRADIEFKKMQHLGFSPVLEIEYRNVNSSVSAFDKSSATVGMSIASRF